MTVYVYILAMTLPLISTAAHAIRLKSSHSFVKGAHTATLILCFLTLLAIYYWTTYHTAKQVPTLFPWLSLRPSIEIPLSLRITNAGLLLAMVVVWTGLITYIFFDGYMMRENKSIRHYSLMNVFISAMLGFLVANNLISIFFFWSVMGICSYLLVYHRNYPQNSAYASIQAFLYAKIGDIGFILGICLIGAFFSTTDMHSLQKVFQQENILQFEYVALWLSICGSLFIWSAMSKSAQLPFQAWLTRAMIAPIPISALLHSATVVSMGIILLVRLSFLFTPFTYNLLFCIGIATAFYGSIMALRSLQTKTMLVYSTIAQMGIIFMLIGLEYITEALLYLIIHALFKGLLFLCTGAIFWYRNPSFPHKYKYLSDLGGMRNRAPIAYVCTLIGACSMAGLPLLSGAVNKDILITALSMQNATIIFLGGIVILLTSLYSAKLVFFLVFNPTATAPSIRLALPYKRKWRKINVALIINAIGCIGFWFNTSFSAQNNTPWLLAQLGDTAFMGTPLWEYPMGEQRNHWEWIVILPLLGFVGYLLFAHIKMPFLTPKISHVGRRRAYKYEKWIEGQVLYTLLIRAILWSKDGVMMIEEKSGYFLKKTLLIIAAMGAVGAKAIEWSVFDTLIPAIGKGSVNGARKLYEWSGKTLSTQLSQAFLILLLIIIGIILMQ